MPKSPAEESPLAPQVPNPTPEPEQPFVLAREEVRRLLRVNETTIEAWLRAGRLDRVGALSAPTAPTSSVDEAELIAVHDGRLTQRLERLLDDEARERLFLAGQPAHVRLAVARKLAVRQSARLRQQRQEKARKARVGSRSLRARTRGRRIPRAEQVRRTVRRFEDVQRLMVSKVRRSEDRKQVGGGARRPSVRRVPAGPKVRGVQRGRKTRLDPERLDALVEQLFESSAPPTRARTRQDRRGGRRRGEPAPAAGVEKTTSPDAETVADREPHAEDPSAATDRILPPGDRGEDPAPGGEPWTELATPPPDDGIDWEAFADPVGQPGAATGAPVAPDERATDEPRSDEASAEAAEEAEDALRLDELEQATREREGPEALVDLFGPELLERVGLAASSLLEEAEALGPAADPEPARGSTGLEDTHGGLDRMDSEQEEVRDPEEPFLAEPGRDPEAPADAAESISGEDDPEPAADDDPSSDDPRSDLLGTDGGLAAEDGPAVRGQDIAAADQASPEATSEPVPAAPSTSAASSMSSVEVPTAADLKAEIERRGALVVAVDPLEVEAEAAAEAATSGEAAEAPGAETDANPDPDPDPPAPTEPDLLPLEAVWLATGRLVEGEGYLADLDLQEQPHWVPTLEAPPASPFPERPHAPQAAVSQELRTRWESALARWLVDHADDLAPFLDMEPDELRDSVSAIADLLDDEQKRHVLHLAWGNGEQARDPFSFDEDDDDPNGPDEHADTGVAVAASASRPSAEEDSDGVELAHGRTDAAELLTAEEDSLEESAAKAEVPSEAAAEDLAAPEPAGEPAGDGPAPEEQGLGDEPERTDPEEVAAVVSGDPEDASAVGAETVADSVASEVVGDAEIGSATDVDTGAAAPEEVDVEDDVELSEVESETEAGTAVEAETLQSADDVACATEDDPVAEAAPPSEAELMADRGPPESEFSSGTGEEAFAEDPAEPDVVDGESEVGSETGQDVEAGAEEPSQEVLADGAAAETVAEAPGEEGDDAVVGAADDPGAAVAEAPKAAASFADLVDQFHAPVEEAEEAEDEPGAVHVEVLVDEDVDAAEAEAAGLAAAGPADAQAGVPDPEPPAPSAPGTEAVVGAAEGEPEREAETEPEAASSGADEDAAGSEPTDASDGSEEPEAPEEAPAAGDEAPAEAASGRATRDYAPSQEEIAALLHDESAAGRHGAFEQDDEFRQRMQLLDEAVRALQEPGPGSLQDGLERVADEVRADREATTGVADGVAAVGAEVGRLREEVSSSSRATLASVAALHDVRATLESRLASDGRPAPAAALGPAVVERTEYAEAPFFDRPLMWTGAAVLMVSWAVTFWIKTSDWRLALGGLVFANFAACAAILFSKHGRL